MVSLIKVKSPDEVAQLASNKIISQVKAVKNTTLGLITGSTPIEIYKLVSQMSHQNKAIDWSDIVTFNLDEYVGLQPNDENSYHYFMHHHLFKNVDIHPENIHIPNVCDDLAKNIEDYQALLKKYPIQLQLLGLGENGHIGFNEPFSSPEERMRVVKLTDATITANQRFFNDKNAVPTHALTMGIKDILDATSILVVAFGKNKSEAIKHLVEGEIDPQWPCTYLKNHPQVTVIADEAACSLLKE